MGLHGRGGLRGDAADRPTRVRRVELVAGQRRPGRAPVQHAAFPIARRKSQLVSPVGNSHYDAMQARLNRRFSDFYQLNVNYTWSKSITTAGIPDSDNGLRINIPQFFHLNRSLSNFDRTHNAQITSIIELPFGKGRKWLSDGGVLSWIVGGWQVNNIFSFLSGQPFSVTADGASLNAPESDQRADLVKSTVSKPGGVGQRQFLLRSVCFCRIPGSDWVRRSSDSERPAGTCCAAPESAAGTSVSSASSGSQKR